MKSKRKMRKLCKWLNYLSGFSGCGPSALDEKPATNLGRKEKIFVDKYLNDVKKIKHNAFREACLDILGEDIDDMF